MLRFIDAQALAPAAHAVPARHAPPRESVDLTKCLDEIEAIVPPLWPLADYVAVNPFLGVLQHNFLTARSMLRQVRDCELLPSMDYFRTKFERGEITREDIDRACRQCTQQHPEFYGEVDAEWVLRTVTDQESSLPTAERRFFTFAEFVDLRLNSSWTSHIINDISRHCGAYYDEGQASWTYPWKQLSLYPAWRESALISRRMGQLGLHAFRDVVGRLPAEPRAAIAWLLDELQIPAPHWRGVLQCQMFSVAGWASLVKQRAGEAKQSERTHEDLLGLLAIRLAYDAALIESHGESLAHEYRESQRSLAANSAVAVADEVLARYAMQVAAEVSYRRQLLASLQTRPAAPHIQGRTTLQMVFCIDVRSELMRRHLESLSPAIETFGFAGFFGMALEYVPLGASAGSAQCPVLLSPAFRVSESVLDCDEQGVSRIVAARGLRRTFRKTWKSFQTSAVSCFSFVESLGLLYFGKLLTDSLRLTRPVASAALDGVRSAKLGPDLRTESCGLTLERKTELAAGMLRNLGLTEGFARIVVLCGHASDVVNNPYRAGLDCGACGGHSGEPNARVAAALLNDQEIRAALRGRGISIPDDTWFVPAVHNTTTDDVRLLDTDGMPATHADDFAQVQSWLCEASARCRTERCGRLGASTARDVFRRSRDWSEVRPEWGLAGNAAFIVAPRSRTRRLDLRGRVFMHSYDQAKDPERKVLELIMTAPMIVTSWINLQYYASAIDNRSFGSGNKTIHNVVGQIGVLSGNGGDLQTGLPWQSVHDGTQLQHEPLRLLVVIEASRQAVQSMIDAHSTVYDLASNGWLTIVALENDQFYRWTGASGWELELPTQPQGHVSRKTFEASFA